MLRNGITMPGNSDIDGPIPRSRDILNESEGGSAVDVHVDLCWSEGDPCLRVTEAEGGLRVEADPRLSLAQVDHACVELGDRGEAVRRAWQEHVGLSEESTAS